MPALLAKVVVYALVAPTLGAAHSPSAMRRQAELVAGKIGRKAANAPWPAADPVQARFVQVFPRSGEELTFRRTRGHNQAVVLIHGLHVLPLPAGSPGKARLHTWQEPGSKLVEALSLHTDVFAFAYSQNVAVEEIAGVPALGENIRRLRVLGYTEIVLVGHSAGGLIARQFVEDYPDAGVTKVVQVCTPNKGAGWAQLDPSILRNQRVFVHSLTKEGRSAYLLGRPHKRIPETVQFVCIVGDEVGLGDGVVSCQSQWPPDLQEQGIPALRVRTTHFTVMRTQAGIQRIAELAHVPTPRWGSAEVGLLRKELQAR